MGLRVGDVVGGCLEFKVGVPIRLGLQFGVGIGLRLRMEIRGDA